jgi:hypothetical protein
MFEKFISKRNEKMNLRDREERNVEENPLQEGIQQTVQEKEKEPLKENVINISDSDEQSQIFPSSQEAILADESDQNVIAKILVI